MAQQNCRRPSTFPIFITNIIFRMLKRIKNILFPLHSSVIIGASFVYFQSDFRTISYTSSRIYNAAPVD